MFEIYDPAVDIEVNTDENSASSADEGADTVEKAQDNIVEPERQTSEQRVHEQDSAVDEKLQEKMEELLKNS